MTDEYLKFAIFVQDFCFCFFFFFILLGYILYGLSANIHAVSGKYYNAYIYI